MRVAEHEQERGRAASARKQSAACERRILTLEVPVALPGNGHGVQGGAFSTPPSPQFARTQPVVRKTSVNIANAAEWNEYQRAAAAYACAADHDGMFAVQTRTDSYSRSPSLASRDASPREEMPKAPPSPSSRRLPSLSSVAHAKSTEAAPRTFRNDGERNTSLRRRFLRPQCAISDIDAYYQSVDGEQRAAEPAISGRHSADRELRPKDKLSTSKAEASLDSQGETEDRRARSGSTDCDPGGSRASIRRSETARNASPGAVGVQRPRDQRPVDGPKRLAPPRKVSVGAPANVNEVVRRNRAFSTVVNDREHKASRSGSLSSTRSTNGSNSTLSDVSSLQYIELYRALKDREQLLDEIRESFKLFDKDGDGTVSKEELAVVMRQLGLSCTELELQKMISEVDEDGNGCLDFSEFSKMMLARFGELEQQDRTLQRVFKVFDKDGDGFIDAKELKRVMSSFGESLSDQEINDMIATADTDGDGKVSYDEFARTLSTVGIGGKAK